jgi:hypothetical protein
MKASTGTHHPATCKLFRDVGFCRSVDRRVHAAREIVEQLPRTTRDVELLLTGTPHRLSREVQYAVLNMLDSLPLRQPDVKRLLPTVLRLLANANSSGDPWRKIGCLLGDGFLTHADEVTRRQIVSELLNIVRTARSVHARNAAFHGIEHALNTAPLSEGKEMLNVIREIASADRALSLRRSAYSLLKDGDWWGTGASPRLHAYARKLGKPLRIDDYY